MKSIGIIGGVTWVSTTEYYKLINQKVNSILGGQHSAKIVVNSVDFAEVLSYLEDNQWNKIGDLMVVKATQLKKAGADFIAISSNTMAKIGQYVSDKTDIELISIFKSTAKEINKKELKRVALLGTGFTMNDPFFIEELANYGVNAIVPNAQEIKLIDDIIFSELTKEIISEKSKNTFMAIINRMEKEEGIDGVILGCTEIPLLIQAKDSHLPLFDTTEIHTDYIVHYALG